MSGAGLTGRKQEQPQQQLRPNQGDPVRDSFPLPDLFVFNHLALPLYTLVPGLSLTLT